MKKNFDLDSRNVGGLKQITDNMYFHHKALIDVKPAIHIKPPKPVEIIYKIPLKHVNQKKGKKPVMVDLPIYKNKNEFNNVFKTYETVYTMKKGGIDTSAPITMNFRRNLTGNVSKREKNQQQEHLLNLKAQIKRIQSASSKTERKKNPFDPTVNPPRFFRREGESTANMRIDKLMEHMTKKHRQIEDSKDQSKLSQLYDSATKRRNEHLGVQQIQKKVPNRPQSAQPVKNIHIRANPENESEELPQFVDQVPKVQGNDPQDYIKLKKDLIGTIFKYRIYRTDDLESLFGRVLVHNPHLEMEKAEELFQDIRYEFMQ